MIEKACCKKRAFLLVGKVEKVRRWRVGRWRVEGLKWLEGGGLERLKRLEGGGLEGGGLEGWRVGGLERLKD